VFNIIATAAFAYISKTENELKEFVDKNRNRIDEKLLVTYYASPTLASLGDFRYPPPFRFSVPTDVFTLLTKLSYLDFQIIENHSDPKACLAVDAKYPEKAASSLGQLLDENRHAIIYTDNEFYGMDEDEMIKEDLD